MQSLTTVTTIESSEVIANKVLDIIKHFFNFFYFFLDFLLKN